VGPTLQQIPRSCGCWIVIDGHRAARPTILPDLDRREDRAIGTHDSCFALRILADYEVIEGVRGVPKEETIARSASSVDLPATERQRYYAGRAHAGNGAAPERAELRDARLRARGRCAIAQLEDLLVGAKSPEVRLRSTVVSCETPRVGGRDECLNAVADAWAARLPAKSEGIGIRSGIVPRVRVEVRIPGTEPDRILADKPLQPGVVVARPVVVQAGAVHAPPPFPPVPARARPRQVLVDPQHEELLQARSGQRAGPTISVIGVFKPLIVTSAFLVAASQ
jgi:hypothetical protein